MDDKTSEDHLFESVFNSLPDACIAVEADDLTVWSVNRQFVACFYAVDSTKDLTLSALLESASFEPASVRALMGTASDCGIDKSQKEICAVSKGKSWVVDVRPVETQVRNLLLLSFKVPSQSASSVCNVIDSKPDDKTFQVISGVAHELRTPLGGIVGLNELLLSGGLQNEQLMFAQNIQTSAQSMLAILSDIVEMGKIESGKVELTPIKFTVAAWLAELMLTLEFSPQFKKIKFTCDLDERVPDSLEADAARLKQAVLNVILVMSKFLEAGSIALRVAFESKVDERIFVRFTIDAPKISAVRDGQPIMLLLSDPSIQVKRFDSVWMRLHTTRRLVEMMGGKAESSVNAEHSAVDLIVPFPAVN